MYINPNIYIEHENFIELQIIYKDTIKSVIFDKDNYNDVKQYHWRTAKKKDKFYAITGQNKNGNKAIYMHDLILNKVKEPGEEIDHVNGNSLDNRKLNLEKVSRLQNIQNSKVRNDNKTSGIRGVSYSKQYDSWRVDFAFNKIRYGTLTLKTFEEAVYLRYCFEEYFGLHICKDNLLAKDIIENPPYNANEIKQKALDRIKIKQK